MMNNSDPARPPETLFKPQDLEVARANIERHVSARRFLDDILASVAVIRDVAGDDLSQWIPRETPNSELFTMCPACEAAPVHGHYSWVPQNPDQLTCTTCSTVYPNSDYPEEVVFRTGFGGGQEITYYTGKHWDLIGFPFVSSWTANIRARKCEYMARTARQCALAYVLTQEIGHAEKARDILLRFAEVYPGYMVHSGYGEFSDAPAEVAARNILDLPKPELVVPPNRPDRKLHVGYWMAGRATGVGMEGTFVSDVTIAYDLTRGARAAGRPVYTPETRRKIERDLLLESTILLLADPNFNNKSATNRSAAGLVGLCLDDPDLVRFGLDGFNHFVYNWFLEDGMSSESPGYGFMTLNGIRHFGDAAHGYSFPRDSGLPEAGPQELDIYGDSRYRAVLEGYVVSPMPDLGYGVIADDVTACRMSVEIADMIAARYGNANHVALLAELCDFDLENHGGEYALFHRDPDLRADPSTPLILADRFFPSLRIGLLRTGEHGRASTALLSASDWGVHHHEDSLNLVYRKDGREVLTDLGYLWDRPDKHNTVRTIAHNTVVVDEQDQKRDGRGGSLHLFDSTGPVKVAEVSSGAYDVDTYRRLCAVVDHGGAGSYLIDCFRVTGGRVHDYLFHGPVAECATRNLDPQPTRADWQDLTDLAAARADNTWSIHFDVDGQRFTAHALPIHGEQVLIGNGWGERGTGSRDNVRTGETVPYVVRRRTGRPASSVFLSVFDVSPRSRPFVKAVERLAPVSGNAAGVVVSRESGTDIVVVCPEGQTAVFDFTGGALETNGRVSVFSLAPNGQPAFTYLLGGTMARLNDHVLELDAPALSGTILDVKTDNTSSFYRIDRLPSNRNLIGNTLLVRGGAYDTGYPILHIETNDVSACIYTKYNGLGYDAIPARQWKIVCSVSR
ncbi:MAG: heparinase II/III family protein [Candidatus Latescibacteria bacterium]|nr:heparinase II/III family protein [Candidatus Latescibacterota bacterium]